MNLSSAVLTHLRQFLARIEDVVLINLASTVTQGLLKEEVRTRQEAEAVILRYSPDLLSIFRRKCITREIIFKYMHEERIPITLPATKNDLISQLLKHWTLRQVQEFATTSPESEDTSQAVNCNDTTNDPNVDLLARKFVEWFYGMFNEPERIPVEHFWPDAKLILNLSSPTDDITETCDGNREEICDLLLRTKLQHNLVFNPNLSAEGTKGKMEPHGLVMIVSCGTLHSGEFCVGIFEQCFSLARDPSAENNWKIKNSRLYLKSKNNINGLPKIGDVTEYLSLTN